MKNQTEVTLNLSSNVISDSNDATNSHELLLIDTQVSRLSKTSAKGLFVVVLKEAKRLVY